MADLQVVFDPNVEIACIVNLDTRRPLPVAAAGQYAQQTLEAFINSASWDITALTDAGIEDAYAAFLLFLTDRGSSPASPGTYDALDADARVGVDDDARRAEVEARDTTGVPESQPADTDDTARTSAQTVTVRCFNCNGEGMLHFPDGAPDQRCNTCGGTGKLQMPVAA